MGGKSIYFYILKEDYIKEIKQLEEKLGGLKYILLKTYLSPKLEIYESIEEIIDIDEIEEKKTNKIYFIVPKNEKLNIGMTDNNKEKIKYYYYIGENGLLKFSPSSRYKNTNCITRGELSTMSTDEKKLEIFKEIKKIILKNSMIAEKRGREYVGKSIILEKEKYRLLYGGLNGNPDRDLNISSLEWKKK